MKGVYYTDLETRFLKQAAKERLADVSVFDECLGLTGTAIADLRQKLNKDLNGYIDYQEDYNKTLISDVLSRIQTGTLEEKELRDAINFQEKRISMQWSIDDIIDRSEGILDEMTEEWAYEILQMLEKNYNADVGISLQVIDAHLESIRFHLDAESLF